MEYPSEFAAKLKLEQKALTKAYLGLVFDLFQLSEKLRTPRARVFLLQGVMRRLDVIERCVERVFEMFPPDRTTVLSKNELADITINLHAFVINVYGILDNVAWVCALEGGYPDPDKARMKINLYSREIKPYLSKKLSEYLDDGPSRDWFHEYAKLYRDSAAHRIPPYIPPKRMSVEEVAQYNELDKESMRALTQRFDADEFEQLKSRKNALGSVTALMALSLSGEENSERPIWMHPQLICDSLTIHEVLRYFSSGLMEQYKLPPAFIPEISVQLTLPRLNGSKLAQAKSDIQSG